MCLLDRLIDYLPLVHAGLGVAAVWIASLGLSTWRKQLHGNVEFELARKSLLAVYKMRDEVQRIRNPFHSAVEIAASTPADQEPSFDPKEYESPLYQRRMQQAEQAVNELRVIELEGEVLWSEPFSELLKGVTDRVGQLFHALTDYLRDRDNAAGSREVAEPTVKGRRGDQFEERLNQAVKDVEDFLRPKLDLRR